MSIFIKIFRKNGKGLGSVEEEGGGADAGGEGAAVVHRRAAGEAEGSRVYDDERGGDEVRREGFPRRHPRLQAGHGSADGGGVQARMFR